MAFSPASTPESAAPWADFGGSRSNAPASAVARRKTPATASMVGRQPAASAARDRGAAPNRFPNEPSPMNSEATPANFAGSLARANRYSAAMNTGEQPTPISAMASPAESAPAAPASRKAPSVPTAISAVTVRRGPSRSSAQPTGNCMMAKTTNQAAEIAPSSAGPIPRSAMKGAAITLKKER